MILIVKNINNGIFAFSFLLNFKNPINTSLFSILDDKNNKIIEIILNLNGTITNNLNYSNSSDIFTTDWNPSQSVNSILII